jgi:hypothetical protein
LPARLDTVTGNGFGAKPNPPPPIGPGGSLAFSANYTNAIVGVAGSLNVLSSEALETPNEDTTTYAE